MSALLQGEALPVTQEELGAADDAVERVMFSLRLEEGFDPFAAAGNHPVLASAAEGWEETLEGLARQGAVERGGARWRLTARGREVCDAVVREVFC